MIPIVSEETGLILVVLPASFPGKHEYNVTETRRKIKGPEILFI
jgi:hypothetical protein